MKQEAPVKVIGVGTLENGHSCYLVTSSSHPEMVYVVEQWPSRLECLCKDRLYRRRDCKHITAVVELKQRQQLEQAEAEALAAPLVEQMHEIAETARAVGASRGTHGATSPQSMLHRTQPFSIWK